MTLKPARGPNGAGGPHAIVANIDLPALVEADRHHLERALRLRAGDPLTVTDGHGAWRRCQLTSDGIAAAGAIINVSRPEPHLTVGIALTKSSKPELAIQKLTELGIDSIVVFEAERSVARWQSDKAAKQQVRFDRIVHEAMMQSRRVWLPTVRIGVALHEIVALGSVVRADMGAPAISSSHHTVLIGPEGGWSDQERAAIPAAVGLSASVLRAETAAIAAAALMATLRDANPPM